MRRGVDFMDSSAAGLAGESTCGAAAERLERLGQLRARGKQTRRPPRSPEAFEADLRAQCASGALGFTNSADLDLVVEQVSLT